MTNVVVDVKADVFIGESDLKISDYKAGLRAGMVLLGRTAKQTHEEIAQAEKVLNIVRETNRTDLDTTAAIELLDQLELLEQILDAKSNTNAVANERSQVEAVV